ncbi:MAG: hypothetical protein WCD11_19565 [Solirubrobacteraceae bacterium]
MPEIEMEAQPTGPLVEYAAGDNLETIAERHGISRATAHRIVVADGNERIEKLERDLLVAELKRDFPHKFPENDRDPKWPAVIVPPQPSRDRADAIDLFVWCRKRLRQRGWHLETTTRYVPVLHSQTGEELGRAVVFMLTAVPEEKDS